MKTSQHGIDLIKQFEGCRLNAYLDAVGVPTIGYGHIVGVKLEDKITQAQAEQLLKDDLVKYENGVNSLNRYIFNQNEFDALVSFAYNLGVGNLAKLTANQTRNKGQIADAMLLYNKAGGKVLSGLTKRRKSERDLFCTPLSSGATPIVFKKKSESVYPMPRINIKKGSNGIGVKWMQTKLNEKGGYGLTVDGIAGDKTIDALKDYQTKHLLNPDGVCGKLTRQSLNV